MIAKDLIPTYGLKPFVIMEKRLFVRV